ncbi:MAG TPA: three-Cys-motif partner protein TcmP, partial [Caulobacteraceae bacterium]
MARAADPDAEHEFGGPWTELKLGAITDYLSFFTAALKYKPNATKPFELWYVDAFAGSGERVANQASGGLLDGRPVDVERVSLPGSVKRALAIEPSFKHFVFIEQDSDRHAALQRLAAAHPQRRIVCRDGEANEELQRLFGSPPWSSQYRGRGLHRAVV